MAPRNLSDYALSILIVLICASVVLNALVFAGLLDRRLLSAGFIVVMAANVFNNVTSVKKHGKKKAAGKTATVIFVVSCLIWVVTYVAALLVDRS